MFLSSCKSYYTNTLLKKNTFETTIEAEIKPNILEKITYSIVD
jgi:hypothetical protein